MPAHQAAARIARLLVDLLTAYSKHSDLCVKLATKLAHLKRTGIPNYPDEPMSVSSEHQSRLWRVSDRLTETDMRCLIARCRAGEPRRDLAGEFKISLTSLKRLLRAHSCHHADHRPWSEPHQAPNKQSAPT